MKKVVSLLLVLVLALGLSSVAFAAADKIDTKTWNYADNFGAITYTGNYSGGQTSGNGVGTIWIDLEAGNLEETGDKGIAIKQATSANTLIAQSVLSKSDVGVKLKWSKGAQLLDEAKVEKKTSQIKIVFEDKIVSIKDIDYKFEVLVTIGGKTLASGNSYGDAYEFEGTWVADIEEDWDSEWYDFDGTSSVKPDSFFRKFEYGFNELATVHGRALKGVKYYGYADEEVSDADTELMIANAAIVGVIHMYQINVKSVADYVTLDDADATMYIYTLEDGNLKYLGRGNDNLEYADVYYLAASELDVDDAEPVEDGGDEIEDGGDYTGYVPAEDPDTGGDDAYPANPHDNPGTGK